MPHRDRAQYMRDRRAAEKVAPVATEQAASPQMEPGEIAVAPPTRYECGCREGYRCLSHAIARMPVDAQAALAEGLKLDSPEPWNRYIAGRSR